MENNELCKLCYSSDKPIINIFDENGIELNMAQILKKHFWFKVIENDCVSNGICTDCWWKTENFHKFYNDVKNAHNNYINISYKTNKLFHFNTKSIVRQDSIKSPNKFNDDIKFVKVETVDDYSDGLILNEIVCDTIINENPQEEITTVIKVEHLKKIDSSDNEFQDDCNSNYDENYSDLDTNNKDALNRTQKRKYKVINDETEQNMKSSKFNSIKTIKKQNNKIKKVTPTDKEGKKCETNLTALEKKLQIDKDDAQIREYFKMECEICSLKFVTFLEGKAHYREEHNSKGYIKCCNRKFFRRGAILEHIIQHINPEAYKCQFCDKNYSTKKALRNHICNNIDKEKTYKCDVCPKSFITRGNLNDHKRYTHCTEEDKKFSCDICSKSFIMKCYLTSHIRVVHEKAFTQICDVCARVFKSKAVLERHRESHFGVDTTPKLQCNICGAWLSKLSLRKHLARHKDTTHTCPQCGKVSANKNALNKHLKCVHSGKTHICHICSKEFKQPIGLKEHLASHTGEILYTCPYCPKTFNSGANMHSHRKKIHPIEWLESRGQRITEIQYL